MEKHHWGEMGWPIFARHCWDDRVGPAAREDECIGTYTVKTVVVTVRRDPLQQDMPCVDTSLSLGKLEPRLGVGIHNWRSTGTFLLIRLRRRARLRGCICALFVRVFLRSWWNHGVRSEDCKSWSSSCEVGSDVNSSSGSDCLAPRVCDVVGR